MRKSQETRILKNGCSIHNDCFTCPLTECKCKQSETTITEYTYNKKNLNKIGGKQ